MQQKLEISNLIRPTIDFIKLIKSEWRHIFEIGIQEYIESQAGKYYLTNTFLHRYEKVKFFKVYYPVKTTYKLLKTDFSKVFDVTDEYKYITIVGSAGSGKSSIARYIFLNSLREGKKIPFLIELRNLNDYDNGLKQYFFELISNNRIEDSSSTTERALKSGKFLFILDGFDEIFSVKKNKIKSNIESFIDRYPNNHFIITSRPGGGAERMQRFHDFSVNQLSTDDIIDFVDLLVNDATRKKRIKEIIKEEKNTTYKNYLSNPLLLSMFILTFENHPEIPKRISSFYRNVFDTLYSKHDGITKSSFIREKETKLQKQDFEDILKLFCYLTFFKGDFSFTEEYLSEIFDKIKKKRNYNYDSSLLTNDLRTSISILIKDGLEFKFPHRSLQEYFSALFIKDLDTNQKKKVYNTYMKIIDRKSSDYSMHFLKICEEIDKKNVYKFFFIPILKKIIQKVDSSSSESIVLDSHELFGFRISFFGENEIDITTTGNLYFSVILYLDLRKEFIPKKLPENLGEFLKWHRNALSNCFSKTTIKKFKDGEDNGSLRNHWNKKLKAHLKKSGLIESYVAGIESCKHKIVDLEGIVKEDELAIDDLLSEI